MIGFVIQNETHAKNFRILIDDMIAIGLEPSEVGVIHLDATTGMDTRSLIPREFQVPFEPVSKKAFHRMNGLQRACWLIENDSEIRDAVRHWELLVMGCDAAIQRRMAQTVKRAGGLVYLMLDGILQHWPVSGRQRLKPLAFRTLQRGADTLGLGHLCPSTVGHSQIDRCFVMHESVHDVLRDQGVRYPIEITTLPRVAEQKKTVEKVREQFCGVAKRVLYVTGAYKWHGQYRESRLQWRDLMDLNEFAEQNSDIQFRIRIHPRELRSEYEAISWATNVNLTDVRTPPSHDMAWASCILTARSTMALEASQIGIPAYIYAANFPFPDKRSLFHSNGFTIIENMNDLVIPPIEPLNNIHQLETNHHLASEFMLAANKQATTAL